QPSVYFKSYLYYRWKWENYPKIGFIERVPIHLDIELTTRCNYDCIMCPRTYLNLENIDLPFETVMEVIDEFMDKGGSSIKFVYLGEATLYKYLVDVILYAKQRGIIETILATNGSLLTEELSANLIKAGLDWLTFSIDSCKPEIYKQIRVNGNLNIVVKNVKNFYRIRKELNSKKPKIVIQCIRMDLNKDEIDSGEYKRFWEDYTDNISIRISKLEAYDNTEILPEAPDFFCVSPFIRLTVRADGKIVLCCGERRDNKILGDIKENTIEEIWLGKEFNKIRDILKEGKVHLIKQCQTCAMLLNYHKGRDR
ncbi:unnamed protein product, partial [marine sediment metagenome]